MFLAFDWIYQLLSLARHYIPRSLLAIYLSLLAFIARRSFLLSLSLLLVSIYAVFTCLSFIARFSRSSLRLYLLSYTLFTFTVRRSFIAPLSIPILVALHYYSSLSLSSLLYPPLLIFILIVHRSFHSLFSLFIIIARHYVPRFQFVSCSYRSSLHSSLFSSLLVLYLSFVPRSLVSLLFLSSLSSSRYLFLVHRSFHSLFSLFLVFSLPFVALLSLLSLLTVMVLTIFLSDVQY